MAKKKKSTSSKGYTPPKDRPTPSRTDQPPRRRGSSRGLIAVIGVVVVGVIGLAVWVSRDEAGATDAAAWDLPALGETKNTDDDGRVKLAEFTGRPLVLNFFASWCTACDAELPIFDRLATDTDGQVAFVFVNSNESGDWKPMAERGGIDDRILARDINGIDGNGLYRTLGGTGGMPITAFYDAQGTLAHVEFGQLNSTTLNQRVQQYLNIPT